MNCPPFGLNFFQTVGSCINFAFKFFVLKGSNNFLQRFTTLHPQMVSAPVSNYHENNTHKLQVINQSHMSLWQKLFHFSHIFSNGSYWYFTFRYKEYRVHAYSKYSKKSTISNHKSRSFARGFLFKGFTQFFYYIW